MSDHLKNEHLIGGSIAQRVQTSRVPPLTLPYVLAPFRRPEDHALFRAFVCKEPLEVEIGFGRPHYLCDLAAARPEHHILGFEIRRRWCRDASRRASREGMVNLRVIEGDARAYLSKLLLKASVAAYHILFPDPWWKKRHHKRRLITPDFLALLHETLVPGGSVTIRTDVPAYADLVEAEFASHNGFVTEQPEANLPRSHREKKCAELGIPTFAFQFAKEMGP